jgi:hypothetical protein
MCIWPVSSHSGYLLRRCVVIRGSWIVAVGRIKYILVVFIQQLFIIVIIGWLVDYYVRIFDQRTYD